MKICKYFDLDYFNKHSTKGKVDLGFDLPYSSLFYIIDGIEYIISCTVYGYENNYCAIFGKDFCDSVYISNIDLKYSKKEFKKFIISLVKRLRYSYLREFR